jgi:hypothetical protein
MQIGKTVAFEDAYMQKFRAIAAEHGAFVQYERDAAARDIGLHFTQPKADGGKILTPALVWFQMKGVMATTLTKEDVEKKKSISISIDTRHLSFWYAQVTPTYLVVYVGALDRFLIINIKDWVSEHFGSKIFESDQKSHTVTIPLAEELNAHAFDVILRSNLVPQIRELLSSDDDKAKTFLRDAEIIKWLATTKNEVRLRQISYMGKARTEVYFQEKNDKGEWSDVRAHWQFMMGDIESAFPYLEILPQDSQDEDAIIFDDEESVDPETILELSGGTSVGIMYGSEIIEHFLDIKLNQLGLIWANMLTAFEKAEIISVSSTPEGFVSVAPWHKRQL